MQLLLRRGYTQARGRDPYDMIQQIFLQASTTASTRARTPAHQLPAVKQTVFECKQCKSTAQAAAAGTTVLLNARALLHALAPVILPVPHPHHTHTIILPGAYVWSYSSRTRTRQISRSMLLARLGDAYAVPDCLFITARSPSQDPLHPRAAPGAHLACNGTRHVDASA